MTIGGVIMHKVSVIVPIYNEGNYLDSCLNSLVNQSFTNLEILLVDDGSTDQSLSICQKYADQDDRVKLIYQEHLGVSTARNNGLTNATGDLISFVDGDDFVEQNYVEDLVQQLDSYKADIAVTFYKILDDQQGQFLLLMDPNPDDDHYDGCFNSVEWTREINPHLKKLSNTIFGKIYKRELFNHFRFRRDFKYCEDAMAWWQLSLAATKISFQNKINYTFRTNIKNKANTPEMDRDQAYENVTCLEEQITMMDVLGLDTSYLNGMLHGALEDLAHKSLIISDYNNYKRAKSNLQIIDKYTK